VSSAFNRPNEKFRQEEEGKVACRPGRLRKNTQRAAILRSRIDEESRMLLKTIRERFFDTLRMIGSSSLSAFSSGSGNRNSPRLEASAE
jgi:hypothetical protein